jgi:hypothetical protein
MKKLWILVIYAIVFPLCVAAQRQNEYNRKGDEAMKRLDYSDARLFYGEGMPNCDIYSINQLTTIWIANEQMRASMYNLMNRCLSCLNVKATENDTTAISQLIFYYTEGIGTPKSEEMVNYWTAQLKELNKPDVENTPVIPQRVKQPMRFFAGYNFSLRAPFGITVGGVGKQWGWYGRLKTSLSFPNYENEFAGDKPTDVPKEIILQKSKDKTRYNSFIATAGLVYQYEPFYFSAGLGYWQIEGVQKYNELYDKGGENGIYHFYKTLDGSHKGVAADVDCIVQIGRLYITAGCNILSYQNKMDNNLKFDTDLNAGMGIFF